MEICCVVLFVAFLNLISLKMVWQCAYQKGRQDQALYMAKNEIKQIDN